MTLNEKLEHFYSAVIESATRQGEEIVSTQEKSLKKLYEDRKQAALKKAKHTYRVESERMRREKNRQLSTKAIEIRRKMGDKVEEIVECIFRDVEKKLKEFMQTSAYEDYLVDKIKKAKSFAQEADIIIYLNPSDEYRKSILEERSGAKLTISDRDFFGGIRAVIPSRSILIDHSFLTKLAEEKETFKLS
jgi:V/A-type H+-transporting ATPase subunit E